MTFERALVISIGLISLCLAMIVLLWPDEVDAHAILGEPTSALLAGGGPSGTTMAGLASPQRLAGVHDLEDGVFSVKVAPE